MHMFSHMFSYCILSYRTIYYIRLHSITSYYIEYCMVNIISYIQNIFYNIYSQYHPILVNVLDIANCILENYKLILSTV